MGDGGGGRQSHFSERSYKRDLGEIGILGGNWHFRWGWFFRWDVKILCLKNSEYKSYTNIDAGARNS